jgi:hypothetical protein
VGVSDLVALWEAIKVGGVPFCIFVFCVLLYKKKLYWGHQYEAKDKDCRDLAAINKALIIATLQANGANDVLVKALQGKGAEG